MSDPDSPLKPSPAAQALREARRIVVKIGSSLLVEETTHKVAHDWLATLAEDLARMRDRGCEIVIVSSGAVALGRARLGVGPGRLENKQSAAVGQSLLMHAWEEALAPHGMIVGQVLLTRDDTERRPRWLNARGTVEALLGHGVVPVVNENDTVATDDVRYGDNDRLAARAAQLAGADLLILLSDVDGLYTADPRKDPAAEHLPLVEALTPAIMAMGGGAAVEGVGTGGMATKLIAAQIAGAAGCGTVITTGQQPYPLQAIEQGSKCTLIAAPSGQMQAYKQWIAGSVAPAGTLILDAGALRALRRGKSLLPSGIVGTTGEFKRGDCVQLVDAKGLVLGLGLTAYSTDEVDRIRGRQSDEIEGLLGYRGPAVVIHRNDMVWETT